jgi:hypothetical protein
MADLPRDPDFDWLDMLQPTGLVVGRNLAGAACGRYAGHTQELNRLGWLWRSVARQQIPEHCCAKEVCRSDRLMPAQHHARMHMYIGQASGCKFRIVKSLGVVDPKEGNAPDYR